ncbi:hypothetical protein [Aeromonas salmonicida]|uniref:hypothetical protein n=1 Tax=Aeromonas salmonicida TaxID=645 RepID=UPI003D03EE27
MFTQYNNGPFMGRFLFFTSCRCGGAWQAQERFFLWAFFCFFMGCRCGGAWQVQERFFLWAVFCFLWVAVAVVLGRHKNGSFCGPFLFFMGCRCGGFLVACLAV